MIGRWLLTVEVFWALCRALQAILFVLVISASGMSADPPRVLLPCTILRIHDGDSYYVDLPLPFVDGLKLDNREVRLQGADTWEVDQARSGTIGRISAEEIRKGILARDAVAALFKSADRVYLEPRRKGDIAEPHGRISAHVWLWYRQDGKLLEVADWLRANGHTRPAQIK